MEETRDDSGPAEQGPSNSVWWGSDFIEKFESVSLLSQEDTLRNKESHKNYEEDGLSSQTASQVLWSTGMLSEQIPNGFYSVIPVRIDLLFNFCSYLFVASSFCWGVWSFLELHLFERSISDVAGKKVYLWFFPFFILVFNNHCF